MSNNLELALKIRALVEGLANVEQLSGEVRELADQAGKELPDPTDDLRDGMDKTKDLAGQLQAELARLLTAAALGKFVKDSVESVRAAEASFRGLEAVAEHTGVGIGRAFQEAQNLAADGLMSVSDASKSLQNLLSRGYSLDEAIGTINRLKDAAAFNRAAHLSMSEAVLTATEGLKNENSTLVDNAGVTKNVAKMWEEYAKQLGKSSTSLTDAEKRQAEINGIMQETEAQVGNAQKAMNGFEGQIAQNQKSINELEVALGAALIPALTELTKAGTLVVNDFVKPFLGGIEIMAIKLAATAQSVGDFWTAFTSGGDEAAQAVDRINRNFEIADEMAAQVVERYEGGLIPAAQEAAAAAKAHGDASQAAGDQASAATDAAAVAASNLVAQLNAAGGAGTKAGADIKGAMESIDLTSAEGVRALALAMAQAGDKARELDDVATKTIAGLNAADLSAFSAQLDGAFTAGTSGAEQLTHINDLVLTESFKRLGLTAETELGRISPKAQEAIGAVDAIRSTLERAGASGEQKMEALGNAIEKALGSADTLAAAEAIRSRIEAMGKSGELAGKQLAEAMVAAQERIEALTPGINSVEEAMKRLGITSQATLLQMAQDSREAYEVIRDGTATIEEKRQAWIKMAEAVVESGDPMMNAIIEIEAGALGLGEELERLAGKQKEAQDATTSAAEALRDQAAAANDTSAAMQGARDAINDATDANTRYIKQSAEAMDAWRANTGEMQASTDWSNASEQTKKEVRAGKYGDDARRGLTAWETENGRSGGTNQTRPTTYSSLGTVDVNINIGGTTRTVRTTDDTHNDLIDALRDAQMLG